MTGGPAACRVRRADPADAETIARLLGELGYPVAADAVPARLRALADERTATALVADRDGRVVGVIAAQVLPALHRAERVAWITALVVSAEARGRGAGRLLVEAVERWAAEHGCARVTVTTASHRADAHAFYERLGYAQTGRRYSRPLAPPAERIR